MDIGHPDMQTYGERHYHDSVNNKEVTVVTAGKMIGREPQIVQIEHKHECQWHYAHHQKLYGGNALAMIDKHHG